MNDIVEGASKIAPLLTSLGVSGLLALFWWLEFKERKRLQILRETEYAAIIERLFKALADTNHGGAKTRDVLVSMLPIISALRDLMLASGRVPAIPPPPSLDYDEDKP
jgi:Mg2+/citrate symporter